MIAADGTGEYPVVGESRAGTMDDINLQPGQVAYITTGDYVTSSVAATSQNDNSPLNSM